jgi:hypothetical protein
MGSALTLILMRLRYITVAFSTADYLQTMHFDAFAVLTRRESTRARFPNSVEPKLQFLRT